MSEHVVSRGQRRTSVRRAALAAAVPVVTAVLVLGTPSVLDARLPDRAYRAGGRAGSQSWAWLQSITTFWVAVIAAVAVVTLLLTPTRAGGRWSVASTWAATIVIVFDDAQAVVANLDLAAPPAREMPWWIGGWAAGAAFVLVGLVGWLAAGPDAPAPAATGRPGPDAPRIELGRGERVLWARSVVSRPLIVLAVGLLALGLLGLAVALAVIRSSDRTPPWTTGAGLTLALLLAVSAVVGVQAWARVRVDGSGVHVVQPVLRRTLVTAPLVEIVEAHPVHAGPEEFPTVGYGVLHGSGFAGYRAVRSGEALRLTLSGHREFLVTVPDAGTAAALVNGELDRGREPAC